MNEVEHLLRRRILPICICSPTLAQGLDLCFGVLLFKSLYRGQDLISAREFANVIGRVGRAYVDLDGLYVLPIFETDQRRVRHKTEAFDSLNRQAQRRKLESGVRDLIGLIISILSIRLKCNAQKLAEYVLNSNSSWSLPKQPNENNDEYLDIALNELDTAILGIVDALDVPADRVADYLDGCLQSSFWQRRLSRAEQPLRELQVSVIKGRAVWLWRNTSIDSRRAYFASGVGHKAGKAIEESADSLHSILSMSEQALATGDVQLAGQQMASAAGILFQIGPFAPSYMVSDLPALLAHWLSGAPLSDFPDEVAVGFIQEHVVYRLVWAIEAARLHFLHLRPDDVDSPGAVLSLCLTYGVPSVKAAVMMQGGLRIRSVATAAADMIGEEIADFKSLKTWVRHLRRGWVIGPLWTTDDESKEWDRFLAKFNHRDYRLRPMHSVLLQATWQNAKSPKRKTVVRVSRVVGTSSAIICGISSLPLGTTTLPSNVTGNYFTGWVLSDRVTLRIVARTTVA